MKNILLVFLGGGIGSIVRFLIGKFIQVPRNSFPWSTMLANFVGCFLIGLLIGWALKNGTERSDIYLFAAVGFCGGLTTFSTFSMENLFFLRTGDFGSFIGYTLLSILGGLLFVGLGHLLIKLLF
ncbi:fluoride efflux transporter CrcB [Flavobacteriaceae bacterium]|jgi:fluoride exporter|nr:fluoride efflux transporter CrcB [Flavobacteriaceae bacterium]